MQVSMASSKGLFLSQFEGFILDLYSLDKVKSYLDLYSINMICRSPGKHKVGWRLELL